MPEIEFTIDESTGKLELHIKGIHGPSCDDVAKLAEELLGKAGEARKTAEYRLQTRVRNQIRSEGRQ